LEFHEEIHSLRREEDVVDQSSDLSWTKQWRIISFSQTMPFQDLLDEIKWNVLS
jgi:hypothetical protein